MFQNHGVVSPESFTEAGRILKRTAFVVQGKPKRVARYAPRQGQPNAQHPADRDGIDIWRRVHQQLDEVFTENEVFGRDVESMSVNGGS